MSYNMICQHILYFCENIFMEIEELGIVVRRGGRGGCFFDASASLRNSLLALPGYRQFVGNSAWCTCVKLHFSPDLF